MSSPKILPFLLNLTSYESPAPNVKKTLPKCVGFPYLVQEHMHRQPIEQVSVTCFAWNNRSCKPKTLKRMLYHVTRLHIGQACYKSAIPVKRP